MLRTFCNKAPFKITLFSTLAFLLTQCGEKTATKEVTSGDIIVDFDDTQSSDYQMSLSALFPDKIMSTKNVQINVFLTDVKPALATFDLFTFQQSNKSYTKSLGSGVSDSIIRVKKMPTGYVTLQLLVDNNGNNQFGDSGDWGGYYSGSLENATNDSKSAKYISVPEETSQVLSFQLKRL